MPSEDAKTVKKEDVEDDEYGKSLGSIIENRKKKPSNSTPKSRSPVEAKVLKKAKKEEGDNDCEEPTAKAANKADKPQKKKKKKEEEKKKKGAKDAEQNGKKRERKVYDLPGQKREPPEERDPLRIFYETLYKQVRNSEMAAFWMMESGLLSRDEAEKIFEKKQKRSQQQKLSSPMKAVVTVNKKADSVTGTRKTPSSPVSMQKKKTQVAAKQSKKSKIEDGSSDEESDADFVVSRKKSKKQKVA